MGHGYMREYDEDRSDDRDRWRDDDGRERAWRGRDWNDRGNERNRDFMLGDRDRSWERDINNADFRHRERSFDEDRNPYRNQDFRSRQDDHYRNWRNQQIDALDRDYADYCREREQQFHSDFNAWRGQRTKGNQQPLRTGMTQTAEEVMDLTDEATQGRPDVTSTPMGAATVGTNSSTDSTPGRARR